MVFKMCKKKKSVEVFKIIVHQESVKTVKKKNNNNNKTRIHVLFKTRLKKKTNFRARIFHLCATEIFS